VYLIYGPVTGEVNLASADAKMLGEATGDHAGSGLSAAGDVDGDGFGDFIIGAEQESTGGSRAGAAYLVLGPVTTGFDLGSADAKFVGEDASDQAGTVGGGGDVNADGFDDLLVGAICDDTSASNAGAAYLMLGPVSGEVDLASADAKMTGGSSSLLAGVSVAMAGDVDADGYQDMLIGYIGGGYSGGAYLMLGPVSGEIALSSSAATLSGEAAYDRAGDRVDSAGDVDGDGHDDLIMGYDYAGTAGAAYIVYGPINGYLSLANADVKISGAAYGAGRGAGRGLSAAGDVDGDGLGDIVIGAFQDGTVADDAGAAYLFYGSGL
jgi:hypothetical protein